MSFFPLFVDLSGRCALVVGGGTVAERKAKTLLEFGASVRLVSPRVTPEIRRMAVSGVLCCREKSYGPEDMDGVFLAVAAADDREVNRSVSREASRRSVPVNVADDPELCTFYFPAVVRRGDFVVGISTSGAYPAFAACARRQIENLFPEQCGGMLRELKAEREKVRGETKDPEERRRILQERLAEALSKNAGQAGKEADGT